MGKSIELIMSTGQHFTLPCPDDEIESKWTAENLVEMLARNTGFLYDQYGWLVNLNHVVALRDGGDDE